MDALNELAAALAKAQGAIAPAPKDSDNPFFKSKYASLPAVRDAMQKAFADNGLSVVQMPIVEEGMIKLRTLLLHSSGQSLDCGTMAAEVDITNPQKIGSLVSYFRRYALGAVCQVVTDTDDDAEKVVVEIRKKAAAKVAAQVSKEDQQSIAAVTMAIDNCQSMDELDALVELIKNEKPVVRNNVKDAYTSRKHQLQEKENANS